MQLQAKLSKSFKINRLYLYLLLSLFSTGVFSGPEIGDDAVVVTAKLFLQHQARSLGEQVEVEVTMPSTHFPSCKEPEAFIPKNGHIKPGRVSVGVRCGTKKPTVRYMQAYISVIGNYVSVVETITPGSIIKSMAVEETIGDLSRLPASAINSTEDAIGKISKLRLKPGTIVLQQHLTTPSVIERGEQIAVRAGGKGFMISIQGEALEPGGLGDTIRVRISKKETLVATVTGQAAVSIKKLR